MTYEFRYEFMYIKYCEIIYEIKVGQDRLGLRRCGRQLTFKLSAEVKYDYRRGLLARQARELYSHAGPLTKIVHHPGLGPRVAGETCQPGSGYQNQPSSMSKAPVGPQARSGPMTYHDAQWWPRFRAALTMPA